MFEDLVGLVGSVAVLLLPLFMLALPCVILLGVVLIPLAVLAIPLGLAAAILVPPYLLIRRRSD